MAQLKDLIVNGSSRFINDVMINGNITTNNNIVMAQDTSIINNSGNSYLTISNSSDEDIKLYTTNMLYITANTGLQILNTEIVGGNSSSSSNWRITESGVGYFSTIYENDVALSSKYAALSHGTHVTFTTTVPKAAGTAAVGTATTVSRSDHVHPLQTTITGNAGSATKFQTARTIDGVNFDGSSNITHYGTCSIAAATAAKTVSCPGFTLTTGAMITVYFSNGHTNTDGMQLNVNGTGAKWCMYQDEDINSSNIIKPYRTYTFVYTGSRYELIGDVDTNTTYRQGTTSTLGLTRLYTSTGSNTNGTMTQSAITSALNDKANSSHTHNYLPLSGGTLTGTLRGTTINVDLIQNLDDNTPLRINAANNQLIIEADGGVDFCGGDLTNIGNITANTFNGDLSGKLSIARTIDGVSFNGSANITHYGTCSTVSSTNTKVVSCTGFTLTTGAKITVYFNNGHSGGNMSLNVNNTGAKSVEYKGDVINGSGIIKGRGTYTFVYNGSRYLLVGDIDTNTNTLNTTGSTNSTSKLFLVGATSQATSSVTYSNNNVYMQNGSLVADKLIIDTNTNIDNSEKPSISIDGNNNLYFYCGRSDTSDSDTIYPVIFGGLYHNIFTFSCFNTIKGQITNNNDDASVTKTFDFRYASATFQYVNGASADYAEMYEWEDGNIDNENRIGHFVTLVNNKIKIATSNDDILGIVSANSFIIGNNPAEWHDKYLVNELGEFILDEDGNPKINPEYDKEQEYIDRTDRKEWAKIGLLGQLIVIDDGTCEVNGYCNCNDSGMATKTNRYTLKTIDDIQVPIKNYKVLERISDNVIKIQFSN